MFGLSFGEFFILLVIALPTLVVATVAATLLLSGGAAAGAAGDRAVGTVPSPGRVSPVDLLLDQPVIALLVVSPWDCSWASSRSGTSPSWSAS